MALRSCARRWLENERTWIVSANSFLPSLGLDRVAGDEDRLSFERTTPCSMPPMKVSPKTMIAEQPAPRATNSASRNMQPVDAVLLHLHRAKPPESADQPLVEDVQVRGVDQALDQLGLAHLAGDGREHLQVVAGLVAGDQHHDEAHRLVGYGAVVADPRPAAPDRQHVAARHLHPHVRQRDAKAEIGGHRALAGEQPLEQGLPLQVGKLRDRDGDQFVERTLEIDASQVDDTAAGDDFIEPH